MKTFIEAPREWIISILGVVLGVAVAWGAIHARVSRLEEDIKPIAVIQSDIAAIKQSVADIREWVKVSRR